MAGTMTATTASVRKAADQLEKLAQMLGAAAGGMDGATFRDLNGEAGAARNNAAGLRRLADQMETDAHRAELPAAGEDDVSGFAGSMGGLTLEARRLVHRGLHWRRTAPELENPLERGLAEQWAEIATPNPGTNDGNGMLVGLMYVPAPDDSGPEHPLWRRGSYVYVPTQREATMVATVVQWLGTNVGRSFLDEAARRVGWRFTWEKAEQDKLAAVMERASYRGPRAGAPDDIR